jgi:hypothetical protein
LLPSPPLSGASLVRFEKDRDWASAMPECMDPGFPPDTTNCLELSMFRFATKNTNPRSDLARLAALRLAESSHTSLRFVSCTDEDGVLTLRGRVASYHLKQLAQSIVGKIDGVSEIVNCLEVPTAASAPEASHAIGRVSRFSPR